MIDLGINRVQDFQNTQSPAPGVKSTERVHGDKDPTKDDKRPGEAKKAAAAAAKVASEEALASQELSPEELDHEIDRLNGILGNDTRIQFAINRDTDNVYIEIVDKESGEVIKTVPQSEIHSIASRAQSGSLFVDDFS